MSLTNPRIEVLANITARITASSGAEPAIGAVPVVSSSGVLVWSALLGGFLQNGLPLLLQNNIVLTLQDGT